MIDQIFGVGRLNQTREIKRVAKTSGTGGTSFARTLDETSQTEETASSAPAQALSGVSFVLGAQEVDDALARASRGKARAEEMLKILDGLRLELLTGQVTIGRLQALAASLAVHRPAIADPRLNGILDEVELRAQVELAKFQQRAPSA